MIRRRKRRWLLSLKVCSKVADNCRPSRKKKMARMGCVKKTRNRHAVREMEVDPSEPPCRRRLQTAISCCGSMTMVVNVMVKRRDLITSSKDGRDECKRTADEASKGFRRHQNRGFPSILGEAWKIPTYYSCGVRCTGGMTLIRAFVRNLRT